MGKPIRRFQKGRTPSVGNITRDLINTARDVVNDPLEGIDSGRRRAQRYMDRGGYDISKPVVTEREYNRAIYARPARRTSRGR